MYIGIKTDVFLPHQRNFRSNYPISLTPGIFSCDLGHASSGEEDGRLMLIGLVCAVVPTHFTPNRLLIFYHKQYD